MLGWALGVAALGASAVSAAGQSGAFAPYPPRQWLVQEHLDSHQNAHDEGVDIAYWLEEGSPDRHWIYVTGWVSEMNDEEVVGTRFATFKYDAADPSTPTAVADAYFPPLGTPITSGDTYKPVAMAVDPNNGDVYVVGEAPRPGGSDQDYALIRYDADLEPEWKADPKKELPPIVRYYNGPVNGDDIPADIRLYPGHPSFPAGAIAITGASPGDGTGLDIATVLFEADGLLAGDWWPPDGIRRYNGAENGDDLGVGIGFMSGASLVVLGTSWGGPSAQNDYLLHRWGFDGSLMWDVRYDNGGNDVATGISETYITGYSEEIDGPFVDIDYATVGYTLAGLEQWVKRWDYVGQDDYPRDIQYHQPASSPPEVWVTGAATRGPNSYEIDVGTVRYVLSGGGVSSEWSDAWSTSPDFHYGRAITVHEDEPYITGAMGTDGVYDEMLAISYYEDAPDYSFSWKTSYRGPAVGGIDNEGRGIVVADVDGAGRSIFIVGVATKSGDGREFTVWKYQE